MRSLLRVCVLLLLVPLALSRGQARSAAASQQLATPTEPVDRIEPTSTTVFHDARQAVFMEMSDGVPLSKIVALTVFGAFRPGLSIDEAKTRFGSPVQTQSVGDRKTAVYETSSVRIEVADELSGSGCVNYHRRTLYAYPKGPGACGMRVSELLDARVAGQIPGTGLTEVGLAEAGRGSERVWVLVQDGCVKALNWWASGSQP